MMNKLNKKNSVNVDAKQLLRIDLYTGITVEYLQIDQIGVSINIPF